MPDEKSPEQPIVTLRRLEGLVNELAVTVANLEKQQQSVTALATTLAGLDEKTKHLLTETNQLLTGLAATVADLEKKQDVQFARIAEIQAHLDVIRAAWTKAPRGAS